MWPCISSSIYRFFWLLVLFKMEQCILFSYGPGLHNSGMESENSSSDPIYLPTVTKKKKQKRWPSGLISGGPWLLFLLPFLSCLAWGQALSQRHRVLSELAASMQAEARFSVSVWECGAPQREHSCRGGTPILCLNLHSFQIHLLKAHLWNPKKHSTGFETWTRI